MGAIREDEWGQLRRGKIKGSWGGGVGVLRRDE